MRVAFRAPALVRLALAASLTASLTAALAACSDEPPRAPEKTPVVLAPAPSVPSTTGAAGLPAQTLSAPGAEVPLSTQRIRGREFAFSRPVGWSVVHPDAKPRPEVMIAPDDQDLPVFITVDTSFDVGSRTLDEVVSELSRGFTGTKGTLHAAPDRQVAGFAAAGVVVDSSPETRHLYYITVYAERVVPIRVTYQPEHEGEALAALNAVLGSWTWG